MKSGTKQKIKNLLVSAKLRQTNPKVAILAALLGAHKPQTADQIAAKLAPSCSE